ncbi:MAG: peptide-methionine (S)-S-oxide reductase MsrA [Gemmatales bacterium]
MKKPLLPYVLIAVLAAGVVFVYRGNSDMKTIPTPTSENKGLETATFGTGCFWCTEAVFQQLKGVQQVTSGYSGGKVKNPTYEQVCSGDTGHAEVIQVIYDPKVISFKELLEVFWKTHDPTTLNQQGADHGTQYRSAIFYHDAEQKKLAEEYKDKLNKAEVYHRPIVTEVTAFSEFYPAEKYHQNYYNDNSSAGYCRAVIQPKLAKFKEVFKDKLKN